MSKYFSMMTDEEQLLLAHTVREQAHSLTILTKPPSGSGAAENLD